jgi:hypothetical protein
MPRTTTGRRQRPAATSALRRSIASRDGAPAHTGRPSATCLVNVGLRSLPTPTPVKALNNLWASSYGTAVTSWAAAFGTASCGRPGAKPQTSSRGERSTRQARQEKYGRFSWTTPPRVSTVRWPGSRAYKSRAHGGQ